jgi:hypothetical protein
LGRRLSSPVWVYTNTLWPRTSAVTPSTNSRALRLQGGRGRGGRGGGSGSGRRCCQGC